MRQSRDAVADQLAFVQGLGRVFPSAEPYKPFAPYNTVQEWYDDLNAYYVDEEARHFRAVLARASADRMILALEEEPLLDRLFDGPIPAAYRIVYG